MRTDSVRISQSALTEVREWIGEKYPNELPPKPVEYSVGKKAQDAHEAIRPTFVSNTPESIMEYLTRDQQKLYTIIWERFVSSQMNNARTKTVSIDILGATKLGSGVFRITGTKIIDKGFYRVMKLLSTKDDKKTPFPVLKKGVRVKVEMFRPEQHFTQGQTRFTDASIVKTLEEKGIGRPSTYVPIISVLLDRYYVTRSNKQLVPTVLGRMINELLVSNFPQVVDAGFTASMETMLDEVEESHRFWPDMIREFWDPFRDRVDEVGKTLESIKGVMDEKTDYKCEKCGKEMVKKLGRFGFFLACSGFPECKNTKSVPLAKCPKCSGDIVSRKTKGRGKEFYGCTRYPDCDFISHFKPVNQNCPQCGHFLVEKFDKKNGSRKACINPQCNYLHSSDESITKPDGEESDAG
jgi:DNA topoisomerase-1